MKRIVDLTARNRANRAFCKGRGAILLNKGGFYLDADFGDRNKYGCVATIYLEQLHGIGDSVLSIEGNESNPSEERRYLEQIRGEIESGQSQLHSSKRMSAHHFNAYTTGFTRNATLCELLDGNRSWADENPPEGIVFAKRVRAQGVFNSVILAINNNGKIMIRSFGSTQVIDSSFQHSQILQILRIQSGRIKPNTTRLVADLLRMNSEKQSTSLTWHFLAPLPFNLAKAKAA